MYPYQHRKPVSRLDRPALLGLAVSLAVSSQVQAQSPLDEIVVYGTRTEQSVGEIPQAISLVEMNDIQMGRQELSLDESLNRVPGLFMQNRYNFAQDLSVSIRGFGARASFGIRGIKVFSDGIPVTLPDGQSGTDDLDIGSAESIEVVRGPSASLYGTAAGGVIALTTQDAPEEGINDIKVTAGEYGHRKYQLKTGKQVGRLNYLINASHLTMDGYRGQSEMEHNLVNSKFRYTIDETSDLTAIVNFVDSPQADDAGGITLEDVAEDREQAQPRNVSSNAGESFDMQRLGLVYNKTFNANHDLTVRGYSMWKDFQNFLPIGTHIPFVGDDGVVEYDREFFGGGARYTWTDTLMGLDNRLTLGFDVDIQRDDRRRFENNAGAKGDVLFDQMEEAESLGFYFRNELNLTERLALSLSGRFDKLDLSIDDRYLSNGDQSGDLDFDEFSPAIGLNWRTSDRLTLYTNYATSFETPTFTELGTPAQDLQDANLGGFSDVTAQQARSFEVGAKGNLTERIYYDLAAYTMTVDDEITNVLMVENRAFFGNADTDRQGFEAQIQANLAEGLDLTMAYTLSDFSFDSFVTQTDEGGDAVPIPDPEVEGQWLPGIPRHQFYTELDYTLPNGAYVIWDALYVGKFYADNANAQEVDSYVVSNLRLGNDYDINGVQVSPFLGINNLFDEEYFSNVRNNAFGGRAYEPAPERHVYAGFNVRF